MNADALVVDSRARPLIVEALEWRLLSLLFERPHQGWHAEAAGLAALAENAALREAAAASTEATEGLYHTTFGPGGPASLREVTYRKATISGEFLAELCAFYDAFAYEPSIDEPPDHVAVEAGFVGYLRLKEAYARSRGREDQAEVSAASAGRFIEEHLAVMAQPLADSLARSGIPYLALAAAALLKRTGAARATSGRPCR